MAIMLRRSCRKIALQLPLGAFHGIHTHSRARNAQGAYVACDGMCGESCRAWSTSAVWLLERIVPQKHHC
jgi:hypothetical protein